MATFAIQHVVRVRQEANSQVYIKMFQFRIIPPEDDCRRVFAELGEASRKLAISCKMFLEVRVVPLPHVLMLVMTARQHHNKCINYNNVFVIYGSLLACLLEMLCYSDGCLLSSHGLRRQHSTE